MNRKKKILLYSFIVSLIAINTWSVSHIAYIYKPQAAVKGIQTKNLSKSSITPTVTSTVIISQKAKVTSYSSHKMAPTPTLTPVTNKVGENTFSSDNNANSQSSNTSSQPTINATTQTNENSSANTSSIQQASPTPTVMPQPTSAQNTSNVGTANMGYIGNGSSSPATNNTDSITPVRLPSPTEPSGGAYVEVHVCPSGQTCQ